MDPLSLIATAVGAAIATAATKFADKAVEKVGEKSGEKVFTESEKFLTAVRAKKPELANAIEQSALKPLDVGNAVLEIAAVAKDDLAIAASAQTLATAVQTEATPDLTAMIQQVLDAVKAQSSKPENASKRAEKIAGYAEQGDITITTLNMD